MKRVRNLEVQIKGSQRNHRWYPEFVHQCYRQVAQVSPNIHWWLAKGKRIKNATSSQLGCYNGDFDMN